MCPHGRPSSESKGAWLHALARAQRQRQRCDSHGHAGAGGALRGATRFSTGTARILGEVELSWDVWRELTSWGEGRRFSWRLW